ncbi:MULTISPECIES: GNAT family N-acetyltransferase [Corynebacterium]|uniref:GNAT family N-acetyltransferase n=1 Tax=Corynebacterium TaxID=1716 RepID=UPI002542B989|nr:GNAT family N-acetyltransferase [Corynebacterium accolens]MDK4295474.1 GNAT family N-acetyltransferase [Corynebacterium accolens]
MSYTFKFVSTSDPKTNKRRNFDMRKKAGDLLEKNGFSVGDIPKVEDVEEAQGNFRRLGLKNTSLFGDHFVIAQDSGGKIIGAARFHCSSYILSNALDAKRLDVMQNHLSKANLTQVFVEREKRDKGIGTQLVEGALEEATKLGFTQLYGYAENDSPRLVNFYKNLGFTIEAGDQPTSIFGDIPGTVLNPRTGGVFFQRSLG